MKGKVCIFTDQHLCSNPRVWKEADALAKNGFEVSIVTIATSAKSRGDDVAIINSIHSSVRITEAYSTIAGEVPPFRKLLYKARTAIALVLKKVGVETIYLIAKDPERIYRRALAENADLYIGHVDCSLYVGKLLIKAGKKTAFDFEDWYSQDYISSRRPVKLLEQLERFALQHAAYVVCPSKAMAQALADKHKGVQKPSVIYNTFPLNQEVDKKEVDEKLPVLVWFSQTIGAGRGIEKLIASLEKLTTPVKLLLVGDCKKSYEEELNSLFPSSSKHVLEIMPPVAHAELHPLLEQCDVGLALEDCYPESRNKTITNKILQYLQAGLKVLATDTDGQREVAASFGEAVATVDVNDTSSWHLSIQELIALKGSREETLSVFNEVFPWSKQEDKLVELVNSALEQ